MLVQATHIKNYELLLTFAEGNTLIVDLEKHLHSKSIYKKYLNQKHFLKFKVINGCLEWPGNVLHFHHNQLRNFNTKKIKHTTLF